jgi:PAS domain S-box-containing protein
MSDPQQPAPDAPAVLRMEVGADGLFHAVLPPDVARLLIDASQTERWQAIRATASGDPATPGTVLEMHIRDISEEQKNKEALRVSEARHRLLADSARDVVWTMAPDGRVTYISPAILQVRGYTPEEAMAHTLDETLTPASAADSAGYFIGMLQAIAEGRRPDPYRGDMEYKCKDGSTYWTEVLAFPVLDEKGRLLELLGVTRDMSDRHALEAERRESQRMESLGRMAAGVAHEINNGLAIIRAASEQLPAEVPGSAEAQQRYDMILQSIDRASGLSAQLLSFSRRQHRTPERTRIGALLEGARSLLGRIAAPQATVDLTLDDATADAVVDVDHGHFEQVLLHLVANARDAMPRGGVVRVRAGVSELTGALTTTRTGKIPPGEYVTVAVEDDGVGMDPDVYSQLFEPFFTTKPQDKGTGLGLPTVFGILKQHNAGITVESEAGKGSRFTVYWPMHGRVAAAPGRPAAAPIAPLPERTGRPVILVVDDEQSLLALTKRAVERLGCEALTASSGREALRLVHERTGAIDLLLTDVRMPEMTGTELVDTLIQQGKDLPVLFVSGQLDAPIPTHWPATVPRRFLAKPYKREQLVHEFSEMGVLAATTPK